MCTSWCSASMELTKSGIRSRENRIYYTHAARKVSQTEEPVPDASPYSNAMDFAAICWPTWHILVLLIGSMEATPVQNISTLLAPSISNPSHFSAHLCSCIFWRPDHQFASISQSDTTSGISSHKVLPRPGRWIWMERLPGLERWKASEETGKECIGAKRSTYKAIPFKFNIGSYSEESMKVVVGIATRDERDNIVLAFYIVPTVFLLLSNNDKTFCLGSVGRIRTVGRHRR